LGVSFPALLLSIFLLPPLYAWIAREGDVLPLREAIDVALLEENRRRCDPQLPESEVRDIAASVARYPAAQAENAEWPDPLQIESELPPVDAFAESMTRPHR